MEKWSARASAWGNRTNRNGIGNNKRSADPICICICICIYMPKGIQQNQIYIFLDRNCSIFVTSIVPIPFLSFYTTAAYLVRRFAFRHSSIISSCALCFFFHNIFFLFLFSCFPVILFKGHHLHTSDQIGAIPLFACVRGVICVSTAEAKTHDRFQAQI